MIVKREEGIIKQAIKGGWEKGRETWRGALAYDQIEGGYALWRMCPQGQQRLNMISRWFFFFISIGYKYSLSYYFIWYL